MRMLKSKLLMRILVFLTAIVVIGACSVSPTLALIQSRYNRYAQNDIYFYDPDCTDLGGGGGGGGSGDGGDSGDKYEGEEKWDGSCSAVTSQRGAWLEKYVSYIRSVAASNQLPWEMIPAQAFMESGGGAHEACPYNPLGLKGSPSCDSHGHRTFGSYEEAFQYYANRTYSVKAVKGKYPNDPYSAVAFIQYGVPHGKAYAQCSQPSYLTNPAHACYGHKIGDPTPGYVKTVSSLICGIQKWAQSKGIPISSVTWKNYAPSDGEEGGEGGGGGADPGSEGDGDEAVDYCNNGPGGGGGSDDDDDTEEPEAGNLASYVKAWAWPDYHSPPYKVRTTAYADYMDNQATYKGGCAGVDCGAFVANIIKASGWDTSYVQGGTSSQKAWLPAHWDRLTVTDVSSLKLGDVGVKKTGHHVILFVGNISGFNSKTASASQCERAPMAGRESDSSIINNYIWYRKK